MNSNMDSLIDALENYEMAKRKLAEFEAPFKLEIKEGLLVLSCPDCETIFRVGRTGMSFDFTFPIICCNKIRR